MAVEAIVSKSTGAVVSRHDDEYSTMTAAMISYNKENVDIFNDIIEFFIENKGNYYYAMAPSVQTVFYHIIKYTLTRNCFIR